MQKYVRAETDNGPTFVELPHSGKSMTNCIEEIMEYEGLTKITYLSMSDSKWIRASKDEVTGEIKFE